MQLTHLQSARMLKRIREEICTSIHSRQEFGMHLSDIGCKRHRIRDADTFSEYVHNALGYISKHQPHDLPTLLADIRAAHPLADLPAIEGYLSGQYRLAQQSNGYGARLDRLLWLFLHEHSFLAISLFYATLLVFGFLLGAHLLLHSPIVGAGGDRSGPSAREARPSGANNLYQYEFDPDALHGCIGMCIERYATDIPF